MRLPYEFCGVSMQCTSEMLDCKFRMSEERWAAVAVSESSLELVELREVCRWASSAVVCCCCWASFLSCESV